MGADLILSFLYIRGKDPLKQVADTIVYIKNNFIVKDWEEFVEEIGILPESKENFDNELKESVLDWLENFEIYLVCRETTSLNYGDTTLFLSGGMSWGDSPTEASDYLYHAYDLPIKYKKMIGIINRLDPLDYFMDELGDKMPKKLKQEIVHWNIARCI